MINEQYEKRMEKLIKQIGDKTTGEIAREDAKKVVRKTTGLRKQIADKVGRELLGDEYNTYEIIGPSIYNFREEQSKKYRDFKNHLKENSRKYRSIEDGLRNQRKLNSFIKIARAPLAELFVPRMNELPEEERFVTAYDLNTKGIMPFSDDASFEKLTPYYSRTLKQGEAAYNLRDTDLMNYFMDPMRRAMDYDILKNHEEGTYWDDVFNLDQGKADNAFLSLFSKYFDPNSLKEVKKNEE